MNDGDLIWLTAWSDRRFIFLVWKDNPDITKTLARRYGANPSLVFKFRNIKVDSVVKKLIYCAAEIIQEFNTIAVMSRP